jgi:hypothetical protein
MPKYSVYLRYIWYNKVLDFYWYNDLKKKVDILQENNIRIDIKDLNNYLYERRNYELGNTHIFDDTKYNIENYMQIVEYKKNNMNCNNMNCNNMNCDADDEMDKPFDANFENIMNGLAKKLEKFSLSY